MRQLLLLIIFFAPLAFAVDVRSYGAKCDGSTDDSAAFATAVSVIPAGGGGTITLPTNCAIATGFTITKPVELSSGAPGFPVAQLRAGLSGNTVITVSGVGGVKLTNIELNNNSMTSVTGVALINATNTTLDGVIWNGGFANAATWGLSVGTTTDPGNGNVMAAAYETSGTNSL